MIHEFVSSLSLILHRSGRRHLTTAPSKPHRGLAILIKSRKGKTDMKVQQSRSTVRKGEPNVHLHSAAVIALAAEQQEAQCSDLFTQLISCKNLLMQVPDESMQVATVSDLSTVFKQTARCKQFLSALLRMSREEHPESVTAIQSLIQDLVDTKLEPEEFTTKLQEEIDCSSSKTDLVLPLIQVSSIYLFIFKITRAMFRIYTGKYFSFATIIIHWRIDDRRHSTAFFVIVISICCYVDY